MVYVRRSIACLILFTLPLLAAPLPHTTALPAPATEVSVEEALAVVADAYGLVRLQRGGSLAEVQLGQTLWPGDVLVVDVDANVWLFVPGRGIVTVVSGETLDLSDGSVGKSAGSGGFSGTSLGKIASGLRWWDSRITIDLSGIRHRVGPIPLSPQREVVLERRPVFYWIGNRDLVRVVVDDGEQVLYRSTPVDGSFLRYPSFAAPLQPGGDHRWWLEADGQVLSEPTPFHVAPESIMAAAELFEQEVGDLQATGARPALANFLRCAYYADAGSWTRVLEASHGLPLSRNTGEFAVQTTAVPRARMGLDPWSTTVLATLRIWRTRGL